MSVYGHNMKRNPSEFLIQQQTDNAPPLPPPIMDQRKVNESNNKRIKKKHDLISDILPNNIDADTLLIAALLFLLLKEGGDIKLVIALGYILL